MKTMKLASVALVALLVTFSGWLHAANYKEGVDYEVLEQPGKVDVPGKIEVREFFWYGCPHCFQLESTIKNWKPTLAEDVNFVATPAAMNKRWVAHAHAFYVAQALGKLDEIQPKLFYRLHVEKKPVNSQDQLAAFFGEFGVSESDFNKLYDSFSVRVKVRQADAMSRAYRLRGVPALVVNGKYLVKTQSGMSYEDMLKVVDFLIEKERTASKVAASA